MRPVYRAHRSHYLSKVAPTHNSSKSLSSPQFIRIEQLCFNRILWDLTDKFLSGKFIYVIQEQSFVKLFSPLFVQPLNSSRRHTIDSAINADAILCLLKFVIFVPTTFDLVPP